MYMEIGKREECESHEEADVNALRSCSKNVHVSANNTLRGVLYTYN